jgi:peptidoglycan hydrolase CwlO-like protein
MLATQFPVSAKPSKLLGTPASELRFRVQGGEHHGRILRIAAVKCSIGSAAGCTLRLRGENIEPLHCLVLTGKNGTIVRRNSPRTYLNGGPFEDAALHVGDILRIGPVELAVVDCPRGVRSSSPPQASAPVDASYFEQAAANEQRIAEEVNRVREQEQAERQRLALELDQAKEQLLTVHKQLATAQQIHEQAVLESEKIAYQLREQHAQAMERLLVQQREELSEGLARENQFQSELRQAQQSAEELADRQALAEQQAADDQQAILQLQQELRKERNQRQQERGDAVTIQRELENALTLLQSEVEPQRGQISSTQQAGESTVQRIRELETHLDEARKLGKQGHEQGLAEQQRLQEEFTAVRNRLEFSIVSLTEQLQKREAELAAAHERSGECAGTLTHALDEARRDLRELQVQRSEEEVERTAFRTRLEEQLAGLTTRLAQQEKELADGAAELTELRHQAAQLDASQQMVGQLQEASIASLAAYQAERESWLTERNELQGQIGELQVVQRQQDAQRTATQLQLEEQLIGLTAKLVERDEALNHRDLELAELRPQGVQLLAAQQTVRELESTQSTANAARQAEIEAWQAEKCMLESQKRELETVRCQLEAQCGSLESQRSETATQLRELQAQHGELQARSANLEAQCGTLQSKCDSLETRRVELESQVTLAQETARRCEEMEAQLADLRSKSEQAVAQEQAIHSYEEQVERWQSEAHKWQLQAEEFTGQLALMRERCLSLEAQNAELQAALHAAGAANSQQQTYEFSRVQQEIQGTDLTEARAQLTQAQTQLANLRAEISAREETLARHETELREREAAWENSRREQAAALEERSQRIAAQIAQFEAEQAAFARQQATIIQQMSSLEDRVQELTTAGESRSFHAFLGSTQTEAPVLQSDMALAQQTNDREVSSDADEVSTRADSERPETRSEVDGAEVVPLQSESDLSAAERDLVVQRLMLAVESKAGDGESLVSASIPANESAPEKTPYTPPSFLDQAAELARQEDLAVATVQPAYHKSSSDSHAAHPTNESPSPASSDDEDESIEQYMNRLLSRVRGGNATAESAPAIPRPQPAPLPASAPVVASESTAEPEEYVPRTLVPEPPERLSLMRELANTAAKSAIHAHARKSQNREIKQKSLVALISLAGGTSLFITGCFTGSTIAYIGSVGFLTACCFMGLRAITGSFRQMRQKPQAEPTEIQGEKNVSQNDNAQYDSQK